jgi:magnesium transporter
MFEPSGEELDEVRESFGLHELAVEDAKTFHLRPKVEEYETGGAAGHLAHRPLQP